MRKLANCLLCMAILLGLVACACAGPDLSAVRAARLLVPDYSQTTGGYSPAVSPDGKTLAYISNEGDVWIVRGIDFYDQGEVIAWKLPQVTVRFGLAPHYSDWGYRDLDWSPDGKKLVYCPGNGLVYCADNIDYEAKTARVQALTNSQGNQSWGFNRVLSPRWSPDGSKVIFTRSTGVEVGTRQAAYEVSVLDIASRNETIIQKRCDRLAGDWEQPWSADSKLVTYLSRPPGGSTPDGVLSIMSTSGQQHSQIKRVIYGPAPSWSPDGSSIALATESYLKLPAGSALQSLYRGQVISIYDVQTGKARPITGNLSDSQLRKIASGIDARFRDLFKEEFESKLTPAQRKSFQSGKLSIDEMNGLIWLISAREVGGEFERKLKGLVSNAADMNDLNDPKSSASKALQAALETIPEAKAKAFRKSAFGITYQLAYSVTYPALDRLTDSCPVWSPDGKKIAFVRSDYSEKHGSTLCVLDLASQQLTQVFNAYTISNVTWGKDGTTLTLQSRRDVAAKPDLRPGLGNQTQTYLNTTSGYPEIWRVELELGQPQSPKMGEKPIRTQSAPRAVPGPLEQIYMAPLRVGLRPGGTMQFKLFGTDAWGDEVPVSGDVMWYADSIAGTISPTGLFTAGKSIGLYPTAVKASYNGLSTIACVEVISSTPTNGFVLDRTIGGPPTEQLSSPGGIAVDKTGCVYVADTANHRIAKYDSTGKLLTTWGSYGTDNGQFNRPTTLTVDDQCNLYVIDERNDRVQKFDPYGKFIVQFGHFRGTLEPGAFTMPTTMAADSAQNVYIGAVNPVGIHVFDRNGQFIRLIAPPNEVTGVSGGRAVCVDRAGNVHVAGDWNHDKNILKFDPSGKLIGQWNPLAPGDPDNAGAGQLMLGPDGKSIYVVDGGTRSVKRFDLDGNLLEVVYSSDYGPKGPGNICEFAMDNAGNFLFADGPNNTIHRIAPDGKLLARWGSRGVINGNVRATKGIAVEKDGSVVLMDTVNRLVQRFDASLSYMTKIGKASGQDYELAASPSGELVVCGWGVASRWDSLGNKISDLGTQGTGDGLFGRTYVAASVDSAGNIYITDPGNKIIHKFDPAGKHLTQWGAAGENDDRENSYSQGISVSPSGNVYTSDSSAGLIREFDSTGKFIKKWSLERGETARVAVDSKEHVYVAYQSLKKVQMFDTDGTPLGDLPCGNIHPQGIAAGRNGEVYVTDIDTGVVAMFVPTDNPTPPQAAPAP